MSKSDIDAAKNNLVKALGASSYGEVVRADEAKVKSYGKHFQAHVKLHPKVSGKVYSSGSPYIMLSRKINDKGKRV